MSRYHDLPLMTERYGRTVVAATAQFTCGAKGVFDDGDLVPFSDGNVNVNFEIDVTGGNVPAAGNIEINISGAADAIAVANLFRTAIEANLNISADAAGAALVNITNNVKSAIGNNATPAYTPAAAGTGITLITVFSGGVGSHSYIPPRAHGVGQ